MIVIKNEKALSEALQNKEVKCIEIKSKKESLFNFINAAHLEKLHVNDRNLKTIASLDSLSGLKRLDICHNKLKFLPPLDALPNLTIFSCYNTRLKALPSFHNKLTSLQKLFVGGCRLKSLPEHVSTINWLMLYNKSPRWLNYSCLVTLNK